MRKSRLLWGLWWGILLFLGLWWSFLTFLQQLPPTKNQLRPITAFQRKNLQHLAAFSPWKQSFRWLGRTTLQLPGETKTTLFFVWDRRRKQVQAFWQWRGKPWRAWWKTNSPARGLLWKQNILQSAKARQRWLQWIFWRWQEELLQVEPGVLLRQPGVSLFSVQKAVPTKGWNVYIQQAPGTFWRGRSDLWTFDHKGRWRNWQRWSPHLAIQGQKTQLPYRNSHQDSQTTLLLQRQKDGFRTSPLLWQAGLLHWRISLQRSSSTLWMPCSKTTACRSVPKTANLNHSSRIALKAQKTPTRASFWLLQLFALWGMLGLAFKLGLRWWQRQRRTTRFPSSATHPLCYAYHIPRLLEVELCQALIKAAEKRVWTRKRHKQPTQDQPLSSLPEVEEALLDWWNTTARPVVAESVSLEAENLGVREFFVVKYDEQQSLLDLHRDASILTLSVALNGMHEYEGGGTYFPLLNKVLSLPHAGDALLHCGKLQHGGFRVSRGERYLLVGFLDCRDCENFAHEEIAGWDSESPSDSEVLEHLLRGD